jgi:Uma2 family endonuclease
MPDKRLAREFAMSTETIERMVRERPDVVWEVAPLLPAQGEWSEEAYLWLTDRTNHLVEFSDGHLEVLPMPTDTHQAISAYLYDALRAFLQVLGGVVRYAPLRVRIRSHTFREPDLVCLLSKEDSRRQDAFWDGADLVIEIVSPDDPKRDLVKKRREYAQARIPEYWIVNPRAEQIVVLRLENNKYLEHGVFKRGEAATSALLQGFAVSVDATLDAE